MNDHWWRGAGFVSSFVTIQLLRFLRSLLLKIALDLPRVLRVLVGLLAVGGFLACVEGSVIHIDTFGAFGIG